MADQTKPLSRRWLYTPFVIAGVVLFAYYLVWRAGAGEMKKAAHEWVAAQNSAGLNVTHGEIKASGFPFFLRLKIETPDISAPQNWSWRAPVLYLDALPYDLNKLIFSPEGEQHFSAQGIGSWKGHADDLRLSIASDKARGWRFAMTVSGAAGTREEDGASYELQSLLLDLAPSPDDPFTLSLNFAADSLNLAGGHETIAIEKLHAVLNASHTDFLTGADALANWRDAGGKVKILHLDTSLENAAVTAQGALGLDAQFYPAGLIETEVKNPAGLAAVMVRTGALTPDEAEAAAAGLTLMALTGGGKITAPVELKEGEAFIGGVKLGDLEPIQ